MVFCLTLTPLIHSSTLFYFFFFWIAWATLWRCYFSHIYDRYVNFDRCARHSDFCWNFYCNFFHTRLHNQHWLILLELEWNFPKNFTYFDFIKIFFSNLNRKTSNWQQNLENSFKVEKLDEDPLAHFLNPRQIFQTNLKTEHFEEILIIFTECTIFSWAPFGRDKWSSDWVFQLAPREKVT